MTDPIETYRWQKQFAEGWVEKRPAPLSMTDTERLDFLGEYCEKVEYEANHYRITDCLGQRTEEMDFREAVDLAAARFFAANE